MFIQHQTYTYVHVRTPTHASLTVYLTALVSKVSEGVSIHDPSIVCQYIFSSTGLNITPLEITSPTQHCEVAAQPKYYTQSKKERFYYPVSVIHDFATTFLKGH